eukprot:Clim_evm6s119 gene=Clim_evmTU6s119
MVFDDHEFMCLCILNEACKRFATGIKARGWPYRIGEINQTTPAYNSTKKFSRYMEEEKMPVSALYADVDQYMDEDFINAEHRTPTKITSRQGTPSKSNMASPAPRDATPIGGTPASARKPLRALTNSSAQSVPHMSTSSGPYTYESPAIVTGGAVNEEILRHREALRNDVDEQVNFAIERMDSLTRQLEHGRSFEDEKRRELLRRLETVEHNVKEILNVKVELESLKQGYGMLQRDLETKGRDVENLKSKIERLTLEAGRSSDVATQARDAVDRLAAATAGMSKEEFIAMSRGSGSSSTTTSAATQSSTTSPFVIIAMMLANILVIFVALQANQPASVSRPFPYVLT